MCIAKGLLCVVLSFAMFHRLVAYDYLCRFCFRSFFKLSQQRRFGFTIRHLRKRFNYNMPLVFISEFVISQSFKLDRLLLWCHISAFTFLPLAFVRMHICKGRRLCIVYRNNNVIFSAQLEVSAGCASSMPFFGSVLLS